MIIDVSISNIYILICRHFSSGIHLFTCTFAPKPTHIHLHTYTYTHTPTHIHLHTYTPTHLHIHLHLHTYTYTHTPTHTHTRALNITLKKIKINCFRKQSFVRLSLLHLCWLFYMATRLWYLSFNWLQNLQL